MQLVQSILGILIITNTITGFSSLDELININEVQNVSDKGLTAIPKDLGPNVKHILLNQNNITEISNLEQYPQLVHLLLNENQITANKDLQGIRRAKKLRTFHLAGNNLSTLNLETFRENSELVSLLFDNNPSLTINGSIPNLPHLQYLSLKNCKLSRMPWTNFSGTPSLINLNLLGNPIANIPEEAIRSMSNGLELIVDVEQCLDLIERADVTDKMIKLPCTIPQPRYFFSLILLYVVVGVLSIILCLAIFMYARNRSCYFFK